MLLPGERSGGIEVHRPPIPSLRDDAGKTDASATLIMDRRQQGADEHVLDADLGDDRVQHERQTGREQRAERAGNGDQADRVALAIARADHEWQQHAAEGEDGDARGAGERGKESADDHRRDADAAAKMAEQRLEKLRQPLGRAARGEAEARQREQRNRRQRRIDDHAVVIERHRGDRRVVAPEHHQRGAAEHGEDRCARRRAEREAYERRQEVELRVRRPQRRACEQQNQQRDANRRAPHQAQRDQSEAERQHQLHQRHRDAVGELGAGSPLALGKAQSREREEARHHGGARVTDPAADRFQPRIAKGRELEKREELAVSRGDRCAEHARHQREVLHERRAADDAGVEQLARQRFDERQQRQACERQCKERVFAEADHRAAFPPRYSASACCTASNMSAGTMLPRIFG